jgi:hypothetical protein
MGDNKFDVFEAIKKMGDPSSRMLSPWEQDELTKHVGLEFIKKHADRIDSFYVLKNKKMGIDDVNFFLGRSEKNENFMMAALNQELDEATMEHHAHRFPWTVLCVTQRMSDEFVLRNIDAVDQSYLPYHQDLSPETINKLTEVNWLALASRFPLSERFILEYAHKLDKHELKSNSGIEMTDKVRLLLELS